MSSLFKVQKFRRQGWRSAAIILGCGAMFAVVANGQDQTATKDLESSIRSVTVFREQANVVREVRLAASQQAQTIRVKGLPHTLLDRSVRWESDSDVTVKSLSVSPHQVEESADDAKQREEAIDRLNRAFQDAAQEVAVIEQDLETIEELVRFSAGHANEDLNRSRLDVKSVTEVADFVMQRRRSLAKELHQARQSLQEREADLEKMRRALSRRGERDTPPTFDALLFVVAPKGGMLRLSYWVDQVSWEPQYTIHATADPEGEDEFIVQLDGTVVQNSGENWEGVELAFCTGVPNLQANGPLLAPLRVSANQAGANAGNEADPFASPTPKKVAPAWEDPATWQRNVALNTEAASRQVFEMNRRQSVQRELAGDANNNLMDETYRVSGKIDIKDQSPGQAITILRSNISSPIYRVVTPLLSSFAYREAALENETGQNLVGGDATVFLNGRFIGRTTLPPTAAGAEFAVGLGADRQVRTRRELLSRKESIKGGNRLSALKYRLVISNYHPAEIDIRLYDRLPITNDSGSINIVTDSDSLGELSVDARYLRMQRPTGILRWDLVIPPKRFGSDAYDHHYEYTIELDRTQSIVSHDVEQQMRKDLRFRQGGGFGGGMGGGMGGGGGGGVF